MASSTPRIVTLGTVEDLTNGVCIDRQDTLGSGWHGACPTKELEKEDAPYVEAARKADEEAKKNKSPGTPPKK
jgi:hypothetical protein